MATQNHSLTESQAKPPNSRTSSADLDYGDFVKLMMYLWAALGRTKEPDDITLAAWYDNLNDLTREQVQTGMRRFIRECSAEFVSVQKIRELSGAVLNHEASAILAWDAVVDAIRIWGSYRVPTFTDPVTSHVVKHLGGWIEICGTEPGQLRQWTRQAFVKAYKSLSGVVREPAVLKCLIYDSPRARSVIGQIEDRAAETRRAIEAPAVVVGELSGLDREYLHAVMERRTVTQ